MLAVALSLGALLRFWNVDGASLYSDEAFTFAVGAQPVPALLHSLALNDFHPPLFYLVTHYLMRWLHWPLPHYRVLTACAGLLTIAATWGFGRRQFGPIAAAIAACTVALAPSLLQYDRLYRMHAVTVALCALSWWLLVEIESATGRKRLVLWTAYGLCAIALPYVDYFGVLVLCVQAVFVFGRRHTLGAAFAWLGLAALAFVPWLGAVRAQFPLGGLALTRPALDSGLLASIRGAFAAATPDAVLRVPHFDVLFGLIVLALFAAGMWIGRRTALPYWLALLPVQIMLSLLLGKNLAYFSRYLLMSLPALAVAVGALIAALAEQRRTLVAAGAILALAALLAAGASNLLFDSYYQFPDWYAVDALLQAHAQPSDGIILDEGYEYLVVRGYQAFAGHPLVVFMNPSDFAPVLRWLTANPNRRVWYIEHQNFYWDPDRKIAAALAARRKLLLRWSEPRQSPVDAVGVALFDRIPMIPIR